MALLSIPVVKGKAAIEVNTDDIPDDVLQEVYIQGLKVLLNRGASKITKETYPNETELKEAAMAKAQEQLELVKTSKIKFSGAKAAKASGAVMTEARRLAKNIVKDAMKAEGIKISHVEPKEITAAANEILKSDLGKEIIAQAEENLKERATLKPTTVSIKDLIKVSPDKVAKAEAKKAADKAKREAEKANAPLSATQAGKTVKRAKGAQATA